MKIDAHQHFWIYGPESQAWIDDSMAVLKRDFLPKHLKKELDGNGFDGSIAVQTAQTLEENRWLLELTEKAPILKGVVGWVDLRAKNIREQLQPFVSNPKFKGVRHIALGEPEEFLTGKEFMEGILALGELNLTCDLLVSPKQLPSVIKLVGKYPHQSFLLGHIAQPEIKSGKLMPWREDIQELAKNPNVYCKLSGMVTQAVWKEWSPWQFTPYLDVVFKAFGPKRLMIGSDWPYCMLAGDYSSVVKLVKGYILDMSKADQDAVLGGAAVKFYKL